MCIRDSNYIFAAPHAMIFPGLAITVTVLAFNLLGDGIRDADVYKRQGGFRGPEFDSPRLHHTLQAGRLFQSARFLYFPRQGERSEIYDERDFRCV